MDWHVVWSGYVRGNVVSQVASDLIKSFLLHTFVAIGVAHGDNGSGSEGQESELDPDLPALHLREDKLQQLIIPPEPEDIRLDDGNESGSATMGKTLTRATQKTMRMLEYNRSIRTAFAVWSTAINQQKVADKKLPGHMFHDSYEAHIAAKRASKKTEDSCTAPFNVKRNAAATWHRSDGSQHLDKVLSDIFHSKEPPNARQSAFLHSFVRRLKLELLEKLQNTVGHSKDCLLYTSPSPRDS